jgi:hypothetical protein
MSQWWAVPMVLSGGLFASGVAWIALGARPRLARKRPLGLPDRVYTHVATGGPPTAGAAGRLP